MAAENRILTTHAGSLPRPDRLTALLEAAEAGKLDDPAALDEAYLAATRDVVLLQRDAGVDVLSGGEQWCLSFLDPWLRCSSGFRGPVLPFRPADLAGLRPEFDVERVGRVQRSNDSSVITWRPDYLTARIAQFQAILAETGYHGQAFWPAPSPGTLSRLGDSAFASHREFVFAVAAAMAEEYRAIVDAGLILQVDCPDLAMCRHTDFADRELAEFRAWAAENVAALNLALAGIPADRVRAHVCWGAYDGPHDHDVPLADVIDLVYGINAGVLVLEQANARHRHEWPVFRRHPLPEGMILAAGVIDTTSRTVEHPQVVCDALVQLAEVVGPERLMAATDCGFATFAAAAAMPLNVAGRKLATMTEGARLASKQLWGT